MQTLEHAGSRRCERKQKSINARCFLLASPIHFFQTLLRCKAAKLEVTVWPRAHMHVCVCMRACTHACTVNRLLCNSFKILLTETHSQCVCVERMSRGFSWMEMACSFRDISWRCTMPPHTHTHTHRMGSGVCIDVSFAFNLQNSSSLQFLRPCGSIIICHKMNSVIKKAGSALPVLVLGWDWNWQWWENKKTLQSKVALPFRRVWPERRFSNKCVLPFKCTFFLTNEGFSVCVGLLQLLIFVGNIINQTLGEWDAAAGCCWRANPKRAAFRSLSSAPVSSLSRQPQQRSSKAAAGCCRAGSFQAAEVWNWIGLQLLPFYHSSHNDSQVQSHRGLSKTDGARRNFQLDGLLPCDSKGTQKGSGATGIN